VEVVRLHLGRVSSRRRPFDAPVHGFVLKHPSAGAILVDTGVGDPPEEIIRYWDIVNEQMVAVLAEHDLSPADVKMVVNTHLHWDHCGQNAVFPHAPFYVQRPELERARREETATSEWFDFTGARFELVDGEAEIAPGVRVIPTPGHTVGHQSVVVEAPGGEQLFIGDAAYTKDIFERFEDLRVEKVVGQADDVAAWRESLRRVRDRNPEAVHFCHDTRVVHRGAQPHAH
jgi:N-acyl homoserine lactone hydrolase